MITENYKDFKQTQNKNSRTIVIISVVCAAVSVVAIGASFAVKKKKD